MITGGLLACYFYILVCIVASMILEFEQRQEKISDI